jgi:hypothetical protein
MGNLWLWEIIGGKPAWLRSSLLHKLPIKKWYMSSRRLLSRSEAGRRLLSSPQICASLCFYSLLPRFAREMRKTD